jgi:hypothetical protein
VSSFYDGDIDILSLSWYDNDTLAPADWHIKQYFEDRFVEQFSKISPGYTKAVYLEGHTVKANRYNNSHVLPLEE